MSKHPPPPDQAHRDAAIRARGVNVLVDAGAGTGKTTLLVDRLVERVAPADDALEPVPLTRIAAVTFTRKAAGELRLRIREQLLAQLARAASPVRRDRLARALADADTAFIGTIHGFADRLLRRFPVEARLSPSYQIVEDAEALHHEAYELLLHAAEGGRLEAELAGTSCDPARAREAEEILRQALAAELRSETKEEEWNDRRGLDALVAGFLEHRDAPPPDAKAAPFTLAKVQEAIAAYCQEAAASDGAGRGSRAVQRLARQLGALAKETDPAVLYREFAAVLRKVPRDLKKGADFPGDAGGWEVWKAWRGGEDDPGHRARIERPLHRWMATRLVRTFPAVVAMYEKVKARHQVVDQVDLLLRLRDLLQRDLRVRAELQALFDHVFVDEFQDTDPLQAEILVYLCEASASAGRWSEVKLAPGRLTLVGDPKQSIYRFRRADIAVYEAVRAMVMAGPHLLVPLTANFRSEPALIDHLNGRFDELLGTAAAGAPEFDAARGTVVNRRLDQGRKGQRQACVKVLPFASEEGKAEADRQLEATVLATWLRATVDGGAETVVDPASGEARPVRFGDVAVLAHATSNLHLLIAELDRLGVPWSARGGTLFLDDPAHRQFLLGLRAVADRDDGPAQAALLRAPFFAVDLGDLVRARAAGDEVHDEGIDRARAALALVSELRRERLSRPPGDTARDLLERTAFGRVVALGPNGEQRLARLYELCFELERVAAAEGLDFDAATARLREWAVEPVALDAPRPVGSEAVQLVTIHQAKGLEFPVVVWWDARAKLAPQRRDAAWSVARDGSGWAMSLDGLAWEEPEGGDLQGRERAFHEAERLRLVYVAATRARDLLVLPLGGDLDPAKYVAPALAGTPGAPGVAVEEGWTEGQPPAWATGVKPPRARKPRLARELAGQVEVAWAEAAAEASRPRTVPTGVAAEAHRAVEAAMEAAAEAGEAGRRWKSREGRFGAVFGDTVHRAIGIALAAPTLPPDAAVARAALETGLREHQGEAAEDVTRALAALGGEGLRRPPDEALRLEYPLAVARDGALLLGYVDLLAARDGEAVVVDFKTDAPPAPGGDVHATHPAYVEQVRTYARLLVELGVAREGHVRAALLFTGDGSVRWVREA